MIYAYITHDTMIECMVADLEKLDFTKHNKREYAKESERISKWESKLLKRRKEKRRPCVI